MELDELMVGLEEAEKEMDEEEGGECSRVITGNGNKDGEEDDDNGKHETSSM